MLFFISIAYWINSFENLESYQLLRASFPLPFSIYFMKYLYFGFLCFFIVSYYLSFGNNTLLIDLFISFHFDFDFSRYNLRYFSN